MLFNIAPLAKLGIIVCIPCYNENNILATLQSLFENRPCEDSSVEVIVLINEPENAPTSVKLQNKKTFEEINLWQKKHKSTWIHFLVACKVLEKKHAGVGLARKICMDEAFRRFSLINKTWEGIIVSLDADTICVENYLHSIESYYTDNPQKIAANIYFEHSTKNLENTANIKKAIISYELYLRYFVNYLRWCKHPHAFHTIGSAFTIRSETYHKQGGMNKRQAGEDFYFLQKIIPLGNFGEISSTTVYPSARVSDKVPFGTGKAIKNILQLEEFNVYNPISFNEIKRFLNDKNMFFKISTANFYENIKSYPEIFIEFLKNEKAHEKINEINQNCRTIYTFNMKFYKAFNIFFWIKYLNFSHHNCLEKTPIKKATEKLLKQIGKWNNENRLNLLLVKLRAIDKSSTYSN